MGRSGRALFVATILTGSFLLFLVQPMIARIALPRLGGAPAVWNSAMLVYQALLLAGYAYAHAIGRLRPRTQAGLHLLVFAIGVPLLPIGLIDLAIPADGEALNAFRSRLVLASRLDRKSTRLNSSHTVVSRMPSSA